MSEGVIVAIDSKGVGRSYAAAEACPAIEFVSAWARENCLTLGEVRVLRGSNEITAVPELHKVLSLKDWECGDSLLLELDPTFQTSEATATTTDCA